MRVSNPIQKRTNSKLVVLAKIRLELACFAILNFFLLLHPIPSNPEKRQDLKIFASSSFYNLFYISFLQKTTIKQIF